MVDATEEFFFNLRRRQHDPRLEIDSGSVRFDITRDGQTEHWLVEMNKGDITVSETDAGGDAAVQADREVFNRIASGEWYFLTTVLRGEASVEGSPRLLSLIRRLFPPPPMASARSEDRAGSGEIQ